jgi:hypothetical protein
MNGREGDDDSDFYVHEGWMQHGCVREKTCHVPNVGALELFVHEHCKLMFPCLHVWFI